jgi:predicted anti-sigma-YlaC factor YlaD
MKPGQAFARDVLAQALGTLIAAGVIFIIGKLAGVLPGVDWGQVGVVALAVFGAVILLAGVASGFSVRRKQQAERMERQVRAILSDLTPEEGVAINAVMESARWNNLSPEKRKEYEALLVEAVTRHKDDP